MIRLFILVLTIVTVSCGKKPVITNRKELRAAQQKVLQDIRSQYDDAIVPPDIEDLPIATGASGKNRVP